MGVSDVEKSLALYRDVLGYDHVVMDETGVHAAFAPLPSGDQTYRRVVLKRSQPTEGAFSELLGGGEIELIQAMDRTPRNLFENRYWGDLGFIHLCWDIRDMKALGEELEAAGFPFTVDSSSSFDMGEASGQFTYVEDPTARGLNLWRPTKSPSPKAQLVPRHPQASAEQGLPKWMLKMLHFTG